MKKSLALALAPLALLLAACGGTEAPAVTAVPPSTQAQEPAAATTAKPTPTKNEAPASVKECMELYAQVTAEQNGMSIDEVMKDPDFIEGCKAMVDPEVEGAPSLKSDDEIWQDITEAVKSDRWQCVLDLADTRPELFESGDPDQYLKDPEVITACPAT